MDYITISIHKNKSNKNLNKKIKQFAFANEKSVSEITPLLLRLGLLELEKTAIVDYFKEEQNGEIY